MLIAAMFLAHYGWRSFAYPLLQRGGKATPVLIWLLAVIFCMYNGLLQVHPSTSVHSRRLFPIQGQRRKEFHLPAKCKCEGFMYRDLCTPCRELYRSRLVNTET